MSRDFAAATRLLRTGILLAGIVMMAGWQAQAPTGPEMPAPTVRVSTHLVLVDVVVTDKQGNPVPNLKAEDFVLEEGGKAQKITTFVTPNDNKPPEPVSPPPGIYSNKPQYRSPGTPITVMLLDAMNTPFSDQAYSRGQMLKFVEQQYKPGQRIAVFTLTGPLNVLQDFTSDPQILHTALQRYSPEPQKFQSAGQAVTSNTSDATIGSSIAATNATVAPATSGSIDSGLARSGSTALLDAAQAAIAGFNGAQVAYAEDQRAVLTLGALNSLARILGGLPGRKNVIWVTGNVPFSLIPENRTVTEAELEEDLPSLNTRRVDQHAAGNFAAAFRAAHANEIRETASRLSSAQVALYPIDARGLAISSSVDSQEMMREMARETGGRAYVNQNEIRMGVDRAFQDLTATYTLGYYPENKKYDGKYRTIKVKVKRDGVESQSRRGYYALDPSQQKDYNPDQEVASALQDSIPATQVSFSARVLGPSDNKSAPGKIGLDYLVDASTLAAEDASGGKRFNVDFFATAFSPQGKMMVDRNMHVDHTFDAATYQQILQHGLLMHMDLDPQAGARQLRLAVRDNRSGLVGTVSAPAP